MKIPLPGVSDLLGLNRVVRRRSLEPSLKFVPGQTRPMKTSLLSRFSFGFHARCRSPSISMCTPLITKRSSSPFIAMMPFILRMSLPKLAVTP